MHDAVCTQRVRIPAFVFLRIYMFIAERQAYCVNNFLCKVSSVNRMQARDPSVDEGAARQKIDPTPSRKCVRQSGKAKINGRFNKYVG